MTEPMQPIQPEYDDGDNTARLPYVPILIGLGALTVLALVLSVVKASRTTGQAPVGLNPIETGGSWEESLRHLAAASDFRFQGIERRLDELTGMKVAASAAMSIPAQPLMPVDEALNGAAQHPDVGAMEPPPPAPAAVSLPPDADVSGQNVSN